MLIDLGILGSATLRDIDPFEIDGVQYRMEGSTVFDIPVYGVYDLRTYTSYPRITRNTILVLLNEKEIVK